MVPKPGESVAPREAKNPPYEAYTTQANVLPKKNSRIPPININKPPQKKCAPLETQLESNHTLSPASEQEFLLVGVSTGIGAAPSHKLAGQGGKGHDETGECEGGGVGEFPESLGGFEGAVDAAVEHEALIEFAGDSDGVEVGGDNGVIAFAIKLLRLYGRRHVG